MEKGMFLDKVKQNTSWTKLIQKFNSSKMILTSVFEMLYMTY